MPSPILAKIPTIEIPTPNTQHPTPRPQTPNPVPPSPSVTIGDTVFTAEFAISPVDRMKGLSGRDSLEPGKGMLFIFENRTASSFWMKEMQFPLDFVWISKECAVADMTANVPKPALGTELSSLPTYRSSSPAAYNFEINAGETGFYGIEIGDKVRFSGLPESVGKTCD